MNIRIFVLSDVTPWGVGRSIHFSLYVSLF